MDLWRERIENAKNPDEIKKLYRENDYIYIMGILSDAQMEMEMGHNNTARQFINKAKLLISYNKDKGVA